MFAFNANKIALAYKAKDVILAAKEGDTELIAGLYDHYAASLRKGVSSVYFEDGDNPLNHRLQANVSRFAAYKANHVTGELHDVLNDDSIPVKDREKYARETLKQFDRWHDTEYTTTVTRSRTAKQFAEFTRPDNLRLFPSLRWIPSRSVNVRVAHTVFYNRVWKKDDPFWASNTPGSEWGCKCDVEETGDDVTDNAKVPEIIPPAGLEGNPAFTGEVFTNRASYIVKADKSAINSVAKCFYPDTVSSLEISVMPHIAELSDNIRTGRILAETEAVKIRPHFPGIKNPEYEINGVVADAKRINSFNVAASFTKAMEQKCEIVIIDLHNFRSKSINIDKIALHVTNRYKDFMNDSIQKCYVVYRDKFIAIDKNIFDHFTLKTKDVTVIKIKKILSGLK